MKKIGITGTIASGKTSVSASLKRRGMLVFNADNYSKIALHQGSQCYQSLLELLGSEVLDDNHDIDPHRMAVIIFHDEEKRKAVNAVVHPFVRDGMHRFFDAHTDQQLIFAEVPLLFESHWETDFDAVCVVTCSKDVALQRMMKDRGYTKEEAEHRYASQIDPKVQTTKADYVLSNEGDLKQLDQQVNAWIGQMRKEARHGNQK